MSIIAARTTNIPNASACPEMGVVEDVTREEEADLDRHQPDAPVCP